MGMFDSIKVEENNVCNIVIPVDEYQTYSLDNQCWTYRITQDGKLVVDNKPSDYAKPYDGQFQRCLTDWAFALARINFGQFEGVIHMGGDVKGTDEWKDYTLLIHDSEIQFVMSYGEVIYSRDPESNDNFKEAIERECNQPSISATQGIMFQQMMSTKHLLMKPATIEGVRAANSILEETLAKLGYNIDGTPKEGGDFDQARKEFAETLNKQFPGGVRPDGSIDIYQLIRGQTGDLNVEMIKQLNEAPIMDHYADGIVNLGSNLESRSASRSLLTKEQAEKGFKTETEARREKLLKEHKDIIPEPSDAAINDFMNKVMKEHAKHSVNMKPVILQLMFGDFLEFSVNPEWLRNSTTKFPPSYVLAHRFGETHYSKFYSIPIEEFNADPQKARLTLVDYIKFINVSFGKE